MDKPVPPSEDFSAFLDPQDPTRLHPKNGPLLFVNFSIIICSNLVVFSLYKHGYPWCLSDDFGVLLMNLGWGWIFLFLTTIYQLDRALKVRHISWVVASFYLLLNISILIGVAPAILYSLIFPLFPIALPFFILGMWLHRRAFPRQPLDNRFSWSRIGISLLVGFLLFVLLYPYRGT